LGLLAVIATSAFAVVNASAKIGGHFVTHNSNHVIVKGSEVPGSNHQLEFSSHGLEGGIVCDEVTYSDYTADETETEVTVAPSYAKCHTTGQNPGTTVVHVNGCDFKFTIAKNTTGETEQTVDLNCPTKPLEITHPNCTITIPTQTVEEAVTYTPAAQDGVTTITLDVNAEFATQYHGGICVFTGTSHIGTLNGSATVRGFDTNDEPVGITAT